MTSDPLLTALLDLDRELGAKGDSIVGGGYGLYLKQLHLQQNRNVLTLFPIHDLPSARTTQDIDVILRAEVVIDSLSMQSIRAALDRLGFEVVETAKYMQFTRRVGNGAVKIDLLVGPLGEYANRVRKDPRRAGPRRSVNLHARKLEEALGVEEQALRIPVDGLLSSGGLHRTTVMIPQSFTYLLMKLTAFRDRHQDPNKDLGRHHALDIYRIVGLLTQDEDRHVRDMARRYETQPASIAARDVAVRHFLADNGIGRLRIREHPLTIPAMDLDRFAAELNGLLFP